MKRLKWVGAVAIVGLAIAFLPGLLQKRLEIAREEQFVREAQWAAEREERERLAREQAQKANLATKQAIAAATDAELKEVVGGCGRLISESVGKAAFNGVHFPKISAAQFETIETATVLNSAKFDRYMECAPAGRQDQAAVLTVSRAC